MSLSLSLYIYIYILCLHIYIYNTHMDFARQAYDIQYKHPTRSVFIISNRKISN